MIKNIIFKFFKYLFVNTKLIRLVNKDTKNITKTEVIIKTEKIEKEKTILFLSDLHLDVVNNLEPIKELTKNNHYDFILIGGDVLDDSNNVNKNKGELLDFLNYLKVLSKDCYYVSGNHDDEKVMKFLNKNNIKKLDYKKIKKSGINLYGIPYYMKEKETREFNKLKREENCFNLLLSHSPDNILERELDLFVFDYIFCGHTHGGQIRINDYAPIKNCRDKNMLYGEWIVRSDKKGFTTSGVGCSSFPVRNGILSEIVEIKIKKEP